MVKKETTKTNKAKTKPQINQTKTNTKPKPKQKTQAKQKNPTSEYSAERLGCKNIHVDRQNHFILHMHSI